MQLRFFFERKLQLLIIRVLLYCFSSDKSRIPQQKSILRNWWENADGRRSRSSLSHFCPFCDQAGYGRAIVPQHHLGKGQLLHIITFLSRIKILEISSRWLEGSQHLLRAPLRTCRMTEGQTSSQVTPLKPVLLCR